MNLFANINGRARKKSDIAFDMTVRIFQADTDDFPRGKSIESLAAELPQTQRARALRYKSRSDALAFIAGRMLLQKALEEVNSSENLADLHYEKSGKPFLNSLHFNISHSATKVVCAWSQEGKLGIDLEKFRPVELKNFRDWFVEEEWADMQNEENSLHLFYRYWTRKESIIKALGITLGDLHKMKTDIEADTFSYEGQMYYVREIDFGEGFLGAICTGKIPDELLKRDFLLSKLSR